MSPIAQAADRMTDAYPEQKGSRKHQQYERLINEILKLWADWKAEVIHPKGKE
jgi:hypothetical protein